MSFDVSRLEDLIRGILKAPGVDLATISAKRVRKRLLEVDPNLTVDIVRGHKDEIDGLISTVFEQVNEETQDDGDGEEEEDVNEWDETEPSKRKRHGNDDEAEAGPSTPAKKKRKTKTQEKADAELARKLSNELNSRSRSSRAAAGTSKAKANGSKKRKRTKAVDSDGEGSDSKPKRKGGFTKEYDLSAPLADLLKAEKLSRPQVVKHLWNYIKSNNLQNPEDRRQIVCDDGLRAIFGVDRLGMFQMNKVLGQHLTLPDEQP